MYEYYMDVMMAMFGTGFFAGIFLGIIILFVYNTIKYKDSESE